MRRKHLIGGLIVLMATWTAFAGDDQKPYPIAIWLVPAQEQQRQLQEVISGLARKYSSAQHYVPEFQPHATLCVGDLRERNVGESLRELFGQVDAFARKRQEISLAVKADQPVDKRPERFRFLFLALDFSSPDNSHIPKEAQIPEIAEKAFQAISSCKIVTDNEAKEPHPLMPHISLMYGEPAKFEPESIPKLIEEVKKNDLPNQVVFESIQVVTPRSGQWEDILTEPSHGDTSGNWDILYARKLRLPKPPLRMVIAGGQTGVDQGAWRAARLNRILSGGWCPPDRYIGGGRRVPGEFSCDESRDERDETNAKARHIARSQRTEWNVRDSDAVLVLETLDESNSRQMCVRVAEEPDIPPKTDPGTRWTIQHALKLGRPVMVCDPRKIEGVEQVVAWVQQPKIQKDPNHPVAPVETLDVAGPSEAQEPGIGAKAEQFLLKVFAQLRNAKDKNDGEDRD